MAAADVSALLEAASTPTPAPVTTPNTETTPEVDETPSEVENQPTEASETGAEPTETPTEQEKIDARKNPDAIRKVLRQLRDSSPENAPVARQLNNIVGRENAYAQVFPKVEDARQAKFLLDSIGGGEGLSSLQSTIKSINETDALLYAGDAKVLDSLLEDMKAAGKPEAFGKLAGPYLDKLAEVDPKSYGSTLRPHVFRSLVQAAFPDMLAGFDEALNGKDAEGKPAVNVEMVKHLAAEMKRWFNAEKQAVEGAAKSPKDDPDRQAFERERSEFQTQKQKAFESEVNGEWNRVNASALGESLKPYLKLPFAKNWTDATKTSVAREIMQTALADLNADKSYQSQMDALWSESKPDKAKIIDYHKRKMDLIKKRVVSEVLEARYPGFSSVKGAPQPARPVATKGAPQNTAGKAIFQATKPKTGDPNVDWDRTSDTLYTTGRFYDKKGVLRTWNPKYK